MDHGQLEKGDSKKMSQHCDGPEKLCDNLTSTEIHTAHSQNLNEANIVIQTQSVSPLQCKEGERCVLVQKFSLHNIEKEEEDVKWLDEKDKAQNRDEDEEEDSDEVMKEEEESEESSSLIRCFSPDMPMTDSSYSETGSLLESSCALSPGTSPEPTSPFIPVEHSQCAAEVHFSGTRSDVSSTNLTPCPQEHAVTLGSAESSLQDGTLSSCFSETTDRVAKTTDSTTIQLTSSTETCHQEFTSSYGGSVASKAELPTSTIGTMSATQSTLHNAQPAPSNLEDITSTSVATCITLPLSSPGLLMTLEQLTQRGDDSLLPQYLHQIAEAFVNQEDYQQALCCIQLEKLYHQRVLDNLKALQEQWEIYCGKPSTGLDTQQLDSLKHICQTHTRPRTENAEWRSRDFLKPKFKEFSAVPSCSSANQMENVKEHLVDEASGQVMPSTIFPETLMAPENDRGDPSSFYESRQAKQQANDNEEDEAEAGVEHANAVEGNGLHPCAIGGMDQSVPAEQQRQGLDSSPEKEVTSEEDRDVEEAEEALEMEDEGDEEAEEESQKERHYYVVQKVLPVETLGISTAVKEQLLHQDTTTQETPCNDSQLWQYTQESSKTCLDQETQLSEETNVKQQEQEEEEEEEYEDYEEDQARILREASSLDDMAKLITIEEIFPASGLVSILKKRNICADNLNKYTSSISQPEKPTAKRRVRFRVPDEGFEHDVGSGDSCLLLVLLCLVTVVISIGGTALYCALGDAQSSVCQDFSRNADFYFGQIQRGITQVQHWFALGS